MTTSLGSYRTESATSLGRFPILNVGPQVDGGRWPARCCVGENVPLRATVFREGHDALGVNAVVTDPSGTVYATPRMFDVAPGLDRFEASFCPDRPGRWKFRIEAWHDPMGTWFHDAPLKVAAGVDVDLMIATGQLLLTQVVAGLPEGHAALPVLEAAVSTLADTSRPVGARIAMACADDVQAAAYVKPLRELVTRSQAYTMVVERRLAGYSAWYEIFPRSVGAQRDPETGVWTSGTLRTAETILPYISELGFDVVYMPPIHPIGTTHRKGPNNTLTPGPLDPGSPYAIGDSTGGHEAIHPELGTVEDFKHFVQAAKAHHLEVALDLALQCSPDHPWVTSNPQWFTTRLDNTIAYAENPPKKYQDIYPLNFDNDPEGLYQAIREVVEHWIGLGVTLFRVDNPHTKPVKFWERLIAEVNLRHPEVIFLAEAFTKPAMMQTLGKVGFQQSYTYFTWRNGATELREYAQSLSQETIDFMRPNFWPTTPDILTPFMQQGGWSAHRIRAILAATLAPSWGIYGGYELVENVPRPGAEEHIDSEKYEFKSRDLPRAYHEGRSLAGLFKQLNAARRMIPAFGQYRSLTFHNTSDERILAYSYHQPARNERPASSVITVVNTDPYSTVSATVWLDLAALGLPHDQRVEVQDVLTGETYSWAHEAFVQLGHERPAHIAEVHH